MQKYLEIVKELLQQFDSVEFQQIPRVKNAKADFLARLASSDEYGISLELCMETRGRPSTEGERVMKIQEQEWMTTIVCYLKEGRLLEDKNEARKVQIRAARFILIDDALYRRGHSFPYLRYVNKEEANYVLREIHEGICGNHKGARSLAGKTFRPGYYWPTLQKDAYDLVRACDQ